MSKTHYTDPERWEMLNKIREYEFAAVDLNLFLDNFPENQHALGNYNNITCELQALKKEYEKRYGVLTNFGNSESSLPWSWVNEPWPWEREE